MVLILKAYSSFLFRYVEELIENGYVYIATPPLYQVKKGAKSHMLGMITKEIV